MEKTSFAIVFCLMFISQTTYVLCYTHGNMTTLINDLLNESRYSKMIRPLHAQDKVMQVNISPSVMTIESLDVSSGELLTILYIMISWADEYLMWNPEDYGGISKLSLPYDQLWIPPLSQFSGALQENTGKIINPGFAPTIIRPEGGVLLFTTGYYKTKCEIDTSLYPFDKHMCNFSIFSGLHDSSEMELYSPTAGFTFDFFQNNHAWSTEQTKFEKVIYLEKNSGYAISGLHFTLVLQRRPAFELINSYIPIFLLASLNIATSFVPPNSGERLSFAITLYLSFIFITSALIDEMPHVATKIALSSYVMLSLNAINTASVLWSVFIVRLSNCQTKTRQIPNLLMKVVKCFHKADMISDKKRVHPMDKNDDDFEHGPHANNQETMTPGGLENTIHDDVLLKPEEVSWLHVAVVLDKVYFIFTVLLYASAILFMILYWML